MPRTTHATVWLFELGYGTVFLLGRCLITRVTKGEDAPSLLHLSKLRTTRFRSVLGMVVDRVRTKTRVMTCGLFSQNHPQGGFGRHIRFNEIKAEVSADKTKEHCT